MLGTYELIGGYAAAKAIAKHPLGTIGILRYDGDARTVFLRAHDEKPGDGNAYLAVHDVYRSIKAMVLDSDATFGDHKSGEVLAWQITMAGLVPLCRYDATLTGDGGGDDEDGNDRALTEAVESLPHDCGFLIGDYTTPFSDFILGWRTVDGCLVSGCGPSINPEHFSDTPDMSDVLDDPRADAYAVQVLDVSTTS